MYFRNKDMLVKPLEITCFLWFDRTNNNVKLNEIPLCEWYKKKDFVCNNMILNKRQCRYLGIRLLEPTIPAPLFADV